MSQQSSQPANLSPNPEDNKALERHIFVFLVISWTMTSQGRSENNIVAFEIIVDESAAMNMLQGSCYFSENSIPHMFLAPTYFEDPRKKNDI